MKRSYAVLVALALGALVALPTWAAGPNASKAVVAGEDGVSTLAVTVSSTGNDVYAVTIKGAKIEDIRAPKGWVGVAGEGRVVFRTGENPVRAGNALTFRILTTTPSAAITVSFHDQQDPVGQPMTL